MTLSLSRTRNETIRNRQSGRNRDPVSDWGWGRRWLGLALFALVVLATTGVALQAEPSKAAKRLDKAAEVLRASLSARDREVPADLVHRADCVGVFPSVWKGALLIGGRYGKGVITCRAADGWSGPATFRIEGGNIGLQIGGNATDIVLLFMGSNSIQKLLRTNFTLGVDGAVVAGPVGRAASGQTDALLGAEIVAYSHSRGLFAGVALDGATLRPAHGANRQLYGFNPLTKEILNGGVDSPAAADRLLDLLKSYSPEKQSSD